MPLDHAFARAGDTLHVTLRGDLTAAENDRFRPVMQEILADPAHRVVLDMDGLRAIDSAGIGLLVFMHNELKRADRRAAMRTPPEHVARVLDVVDFRVLYPYE